MSPEDLLANKIEIHLKLDETPGYHLTNEDQQMIVDCLRFKQKTSELRYAQTLAMVLWDKHWKTDAPNWKPLPDLIGVLTQIDNMTAGLVRAVGQST